MHCCLMNLLSSFASTLTILMPRNTLITAHAHATAPSAPPYIAPPIRPANSFCVPPRYLPLHEVVNHNHVSKLRHLVRQNPQPPPLRPPALPPPPLAPSQREPKGEEDGAAGGGVSPPDCAPENVIVTRKFTLLTDRMSSVPKLH